MLELINLTKKYGRYTAVDNVSLKVEDGEILGLLGPNGAGKSTTVSMISTTLSPTGGEIRISGKSLHKHPLEIKKIMGIVPQDIALYEPLSARDNLEFFGCLYGLSGKALGRRVDEVLEIIGLQDKQKQDVSQFSGGMKRRVNIGAALMNSPRLLILDEPTVGIDPQSRNHILETVRRLNRERGMTVIYTSHYMEEVEAVCQRAAIMDHGKLIALGTKDELRESLGVLDTLTVDIQPSGQAKAADIENLPGVRRVALEPDRLVILLSPKEGSPIGILDALKQSGLQPTSFKYEEANLEHIFLQVTGKSLRD
ncbi:ATP-binding cassette domain-containing protein [Paenibacillus forsythiae]|nr:ABC transporter ATP-binding protein [Paenibacillus forsythiae]